MVNNVKKKQEKILKNFKEPEENRQKSRKRAEKPSEISKNGKNVANPPKMSKNRKHPVKNIEKWSIMLKITKRKTSKI